MALFISKLTINERNLAGLRCVCDTYQAHQTIWRAFPDRADGGPGRILFRIEPVRACRSVVALVQSEKRPDWTQLLSNGILTEALCKDYGPEFRAGDVLQFRLKANPTRKIADSSDCGADGLPKSKRVGLCNEDQQMDWLHRKGQSGGYRIVECRVSARDDLRTGKSGTAGGIRHLAVLFDGTLEVTDPDLFRSTLSSGLGSAKGFGFGLLSVALLRR